VLYICIPAYNEAPTIGVLLWRIRKVFQSYSREYEVIVFDDGSTDATRETLAQYEGVLPLTVIGSGEHLGYAAAIDALCRHASSASGKYARRDGVLFLQADFTDPPEHIPEMVKRFEGGADLVVAEREGGPLVPVAERRLSRVAPWVLRPFVRVPGVSDPFGSFRLVRVSVLREMIRKANGSPLVQGSGWAANVDFLLRSAAFTRRIETVKLPRRYDVRPRQSRLKPMSDAFSLIQYGRGLRRRESEAGAS
jgi:glycosyltransferase involved in cell wall biosynthesis